MPKLKNHRTPKKNAQDEILRGTPFGSTDEREQELNGIRLDVWRQLARAQVLDELLTKKEFAFLREEWEAGLVCVFGGREAQEIYRIFSLGRGLRLELKQETVESLGEDRAEFLSAVVRSGVEGYGSLFLKMKGMLGSGSSAEVFATLKAQDRAQS